MNEHDEREIDRLKSQKEEIFKLLEMTVDERISLFLKAMRG